MVTHYHLKNIRTLLIEGFTRQELDQLYHQIPDFSILYPHLPPEADKTTLVDGLLNQAQQIARMEAVLEWAKTHNPARYAIHAPYYDSPRSPIASKLAQLRDQIDIHDPTRLSYHIFWGGLYVLGTLLIAGVGFALFVSLFR